MFSRREHFVVAASAATNFVHAGFPRAERGLHCAARLRARPRPTLAQHQQRSTHRDLAARSVLPAATRAEAR
jgi:hypothetical protein